MASSGLQIAGHPIHPMIVSFPIVLWIGGLVGDVAYAVTGATFWYEVAYLAIGLGLIFGLLAAIAGAADWFTIRRKTRARKIGRNHGLLNLAIWGLFLINFVYRSNATGGFSISPEVPLTGTSLWAAVALSLIGVGLLTVSGWLGGELVYVEGVGVDTRDVRTHPQEQPRQRRAGAIPPDWEREHPGHVPPESERRPDQGPGRTDAGDWGGPS